MGRITALILGICAALAFGMSPARAGTWQFVETGCFIPNSGLQPTPCMGVSLPQVLGTFSSPDQTGSYQSIDFARPRGPPPSESGDRNFTFHWLDPFGGISLPDVLGSGSCDCRFSIDWNGPPTDVHYFQAFSSTSIDYGNASNPVGGFGAVIGSDFPMPGCPVFDAGGGCTAVGHWDPVGVPEASSITLLGVLLALLTLLQVAFCSSRYRARTEPDFQSSAK
jgi:hypothetical protein